MADRSIRIISVEVATARDWQIEAQRWGRGYRNGKRPDLSRNGKVGRYRVAAATAAHLGIPVGLVVDVREEITDAR